MRRMVRSKGLRVAVAYSFICGQLVLAAPQIGEVNHGSLSVNQAGHVTHITTATAKTMITTPNFDIQQHETVKINQPGFASKFLANVQSPNPTNIVGALQSNGIVYITNPAGVIFADGARIDVAGLYAAAASLSKQDFLNDVDRFTSVRGSVLNHGQINANFVALVGQHVANYGTILAQQGMIAMVAGDDVLLGRFDDPLMIKIPGGAANLLDPDQKQGVENHGTLEADRVRLSAGDMFSILLDQPSHIKADRITVEGGAGSMVQVAGTLDASNDEEDGVGGRVEVLGEKIAVDNALIDVSGDVGGGEVYIGGDFQGKGDLRTAERLLFGADAEVRADAISNGNGGRVIVWANEVTGYYGSIQARGGAQGGDGGFVETSGKEHLIYRGSVDTSSPFGQAGTLLLDPKNIVIEDVVPGPNETVTNNFFTDTPGDNVTLDPDDVVDALEANAILTLQANNDITVNDEVDATGGDESDAGDLILQAGRSIFVNDRVAVEGSITLAANDSDADPDFRDPGLAVIDIADNSNFGTGGSLEIDEDLSDAQTRSITLEIEPDSGFEFFGGDVIMGDLAIRAIVSAPGSTNTNRQVIVSVPEGDISTANGASSIVDTVEIVTDGLVQLTAMGIGEGTVGTALTVSGANSPLEINDTGAGEIRVDEFLSGTIRETTINIDGVAFGDILVNYGVVNAADSDVINISNGDGATEIELGPTRLDHDFTLRSTGFGGHVGQVAGTTYSNPNATSTTTFDVGPNDLELDNENNNFAGEVLIAAGGDATLAANNNNTTLRLGAIVGGTLRVQTPAQVVFMSAGAGPVTLSADSVILNAAVGGTGSLGFGPNYAIQANTIQLGAGDGIGTDASVNAQENNPNFRNADDSTQLEFEIIQDGRLTSDFTETGVGFTPLASQFTDSDGVTPTSVTMSLTSAGSSINLADPAQIAGASLTVSAPNGGVTFDGGALSLASLDVNDTTETTLNVSSVTTNTGGQRYTGAVVLDTNVLLADSAGSSIEVAGAVTGANDLTLDGAGAFTFSDSVDIGSGDGASLSIDTTNTTTFERTLNTANAIDQSTAAGTVVFRDDVNVSAGDSSFGADVQFNAVDLFGLTYSQSDGSVTFGTVFGDDAVTIAGGPTTIQTFNGEVTLNSTVDTRVDDLQSLTVDSGEQATNINAPIGGTVPLLNVTLIADNMDLGGASITTQTGFGGFDGVVTLRPSSNDRAINLGTETAGSLSLTNAELIQVFATGGLAIGVNDPSGPVSAGEITISDHLQFFGAVNELRLSTGAGITVQGGSLIVDALAIDTVDSISGLPAEVSRLAARSTFGSITITSVSTDPLTIDTVAGLPGLEAAHDITVSNNGSITVRSGADVSAGTGDVSITATDFATNASISASSGDVLINADDLEIGASVDGRIVRLAPTTSNRTINLGSETAGFLSLTDAELDQVAATGALEIGNDPINAISAGQITISDNISLDSGSVSSLVLSTATNIAQDPNAVVSVNSLGLSSNDAIGTGAVPFVLDGVNEVAASSQGEVHLQRVDTATGIGNLTVTTVGENDGVQVFGVSSNSNPISIEVTTGDLTISGPINAGAESVALTATGSLDGLGTVSAGQLGLSVGTGIGSAGSPFIVDAGTMAARSTGATGDIYISKEGDLTIAQVGTIPGLDVLDGNTISVTTTSVVEGPDGDLTINAPVSAPGTDGEILLTADGDLAIDGLVNAPGTNGEIVLTANNDLAINQSLNAQGTNGQILATAGGEIQGGGTLSAENVGLEAESDIGLETNPIQLVAAHVAAVSQSGTIQLQNQGDLSIGQVNGNSGLQAHGTDQQISVLVGGDLVVDQQVITGTGGEVRLIAPEGSITGGGTVTADRVGLLALNDIRQDAQNDNPLQLITSTVGAGSNSGGVINLANTGDLEIADVAGFPGVQSPDGSITVSVTGGSLDVAQSVNAGDGSVVLETDATGAITGGGGVTGAEIALSAGTGIGSEGTPFGIEAVTVGVEPGSLAAETTALTGDIFVINTGDLTIAEVGGVTGLSVLNNAAEGNIISVATTAVSGVAAGDLVVDSAINAGTDGEIRLDAHGSIHGTGLVLAGSVGMTADSDIGQQINPIQLSTANVAAVSQSGTIQLQNQGNLSIAQVNGISGLQANGTDQQISVFVLGGDLVLDEQVTTNTGGEVRLFVPTGSITGFGTITAGGAGLIAGSHIRQDANNALQLNVATLGARTTSASDGEIHLANTGDLEITEVVGVAGVNAAVAQGTGTIELTVDGNLTLTNALVSQSDAADAIRLSVSGAVLDGGEVDGADIQAGANGGLFLEQATAVGLGATNPIETSVGTLAITPAVEVTVGDTSIHNDRAIEMQAIDVSGDLRVTTQTGDVTDTEAIEVAGTATFGTEDAVGSVTFDDLNTGQIGGLAFDTQGNADVTTADAGKLVLRASTISGSGSVTTLASDELAIEGLLIGSGNLNLRPKNNAADILIGGVDDSSGTGDYHLGTSDVANIGSGFATVAIGNATNGTHDVNVTTSTTFNAPVVLHGDNAIFNGNLATTGDAITINPANVDLRATTVNINSNGGTIEIAGVVTTSTGSNLELDASGGTIEVNNVTTSGSQTYTAGGTTTLNGATYSSVDGNIHFEGGGDVQLSVTGDVDLIATSGNIGIEGGVTGVDADLTVTARGGDVAVHDISANSITLQSNTNMDGNGVPLGLLTINSSLTTDGGDIVLNPDGGADVPSVATIVVTDGLDVTTNGGDFAIGVDPTQLSRMTPQKLTATAGDIAINTSNGTSPGGDVYVGDLAAAGRIDITTASSISPGDLLNGGVLFLNRREQGLVMDSDGQSFDRDLGLDIIGLQGISIVARSVNDAFGRGTGATLASGIPGGVAAPSLSPASSIELLVQDVSITTPLTGSNGIVLDPSIADQGTVLTPNIFRFIVTTGLSLDSLLSLTAPDTGGEELLDDADIEQSEKDLLRIMGIPAVDLSARDRVAFVSGFSALVMDDISRPDSDEDRVTVDRMDARTIYVALKLYRAIYVGTVVDPDTQTEVEKSDRMRQVLGQIWHDYRTIDEEKDALDFDQFLRTNPDYEEALGYVGQLRSLFDHLTVMGLTTLELKKTKWVLLQQEDIIPRGMEQVEFERLILNEVPVQVKGVPQPIDSATDPTRAQDTDPPLPQEGLEVSLLVESGVAAGPVGH